MVLTTFLTIQSSALQFSDAQTNTDFENTILDIHERERAEVDVPQLTWSDTLAEDAQAWAEQLASIGSLEHATDTDQGENLWAGSAGGYTTAEQVEDWVSEKSQYTPGTPISYDNFASTGHYTQMVWSTTTDIGCGSATDGVQDYLVCRYYPPGNMLGETPY